MRRIIQCIYFAAILAVIFVSCSKKQVEQETEGAYYSDEYHNYFTEVLGVSQKEVDERISQLWDHFFTPGDFRKFADAECRMA